MTTSAIGARSDDHRVASEMASGDARGWYLYGITGSGLAAPVLLQAGAARVAAAEQPGAGSEAASLLVLEECGLAAVVRPVNLADFSPAVLRERMQNASELEALVRSHNGVIETIHARQPILPARFGMVYAHAEDIVAALRAARESLAPELHRLEGCDEWALHLYADETVLRERIAAESAAIEQLRERRAAARPGRAFFIERQLHEELEVVTRQALEALAQSTFERLERSAIAGQVNEIGAVAKASSEVEILRAAFLVARDAAGQFEEEMRATAAATDGLRFECTGPWPPYSFAILGDMESVQ